MADQYDEYNAPVDMDAAVAVAEEYHTADEMAANDEVDGHLDITLPDRNDIPAIEALLGIESNIRGVRTLKKRVARYLERYRLTQDGWEDLQTSVAFLSGKRTDAQIAGIANRSRKSAAQRYLETLSDEMLQKHCTVWNVQCDTGMNRDDIITALLCAQQIAA